MVVRKLDLEFNFTVDVANVHNCGPAGSRGQNTATHVEGEAPTLTTLTPTTTRANRGKRLFGHVHVGCFRRHAGMNFALPFWLGDTPKLMRAAPGLACQAGSGACTCNEQFRADPRSAVCDLRLKHKLTLLINIFSETPLPSEAELAFPLRGTLRRHVGGVGGLRPRNPRRSTPHAPSAPACS